MGDRDSDFANKSRSQLVQQHDSSPAIRWQSENIPPTRWSGEYRSPFILTPPNNTREQLSLLAHAPCSYTSNKDYSPSLRDLKRHAHSLICLIKSLSVSTLPGVIDAENLGFNDVGHNDGETFDFLNNLSQPYEGPSNSALQPAHNLPLTAIQNILETRTIPQPGEFLDRLAQKICPLHSIEDDPTLPPNGQSRPYATRQELLAHANEILELLDHEYSAKGGLLALLPPKEDVEDRKKAESTILGQFILYTQRLVQRVHDLERLYANSMDILASEASVPSQALSRLGPSGRAGRELVYPQDRFVLVNAGEDLWSFLDHEFEKKERLDERNMKTYAKFGVTGEALWEKDGGHEFSRGIVALDITTRYFRLRDEELKTVFVIPAHQEHPGTKVTRDMEKVPTVVSVVKPTWPERASTWEQKHRADLTAYANLQDEARSLHGEHEILSNARTILEATLEGKNATVRQLKSDVDRLEKVVKGKGSAVKAKTLEDSKKAENDKAEADALVVEARALRAQAEETLKGQQRASQALANERAALANEYARKEEQLRESYREKEHVLLAKDREAAEKARELNKTIRVNWAKQMLDTQVVYEDLKRRGVGVEGRPSKSSLRKGKEAARRAVAEGIPGGLGGGAFGMGGERERGETVETVESVVDSTEVGVLGEGERIKSPGPTARGKKAAVAWDFSSLDTSRETSVQ
ncbi:hypothetical protein BJ875DRAFT_367799 [Amylocarpus encephaloides]|uniref:Uncharacterized protein n=1 Tax=Amylocarpus encephaloides TaxID=45428 RepID=A0A9P7YRI8_9HELO|nr:hypothetical protein BJ875DRAFT_367799 [Amylocarpus encephaloides]